METRNAFVIAAVAFAVSATDARADEAACPAVAPPNQATMMSQTYANALVAKIGQAGSFARFDKVFEFDIGRIRVRSKDRERIQALAETWKQQAHSDLITVDAFSSSVERDGAAIALQRAVKVKEYLVKFGVAADRVVVKSGVRSAKLVGSKGGLDLMIGTVPVVAACTTATDTPVASAP